MVFQSCIACLTSLVILWYVDLADYKGVDGDGCAHIGMRHCGIVILDLLR